MRSLHRQCRLFLAPGTWIVLVLVMQVSISVRMSFELMGPCLIFYDVDPAPFITNLRLIQGLTVAYFLWSLLVFKRVIAPDTGKGLVLASFGLHCRLITDVILYGPLNWLSDYDNSAVGRPFTFPAAEHLRHLHLLLHYGGLFAYVIGFALVLFGVRTDARRRSLTRKRS